MSEFPFTNISESVFFHAARTPQAPAVAAGGEQLSYQQLAEDVARATGYLTGLGLQPGERAGLSMPNTIERIILGLAIMRLGAVGVELPPGLPAPVLAARVQRFDLAACFTDIPGPVAPARIAVRIGPGWRAALNRQQPTDQIALPPDALRMIVLSSGSTGQPKGAVVTHRQRILRAEIYLQRITAWAQPQPGTLLLLAPGATSLVSQCLTVQLLLGGPIVLLPPFQSVREMADAIASHPNAIVPMPPGMIRPLVALGGLGPPLFPKIRALICSGQPMAALDKLAVLARVTPNFHEVYGASGCGLIAHAGPVALAAKPASVGRIVHGPGIELQIVGRKHEILPPGTPGRVRLRGPVLALGYCYPEDNLGAEHFADGWYYPGEAALLDPGGELILQGRVQEAMLLQGAEIYPTEIEDALIRYPEIAEAAVIPGSGGIVAFVVPRPDFRQADFWAHCVATLPPERRPREIVQLAALPRTGFGKLDRIALRLALPISIPA